MGAGPQMQFPFMGQPGFVAPPPPPFGYYAPPPGAQQVPPPGVNQPAFEDMFNDLADKNGLGMLKGLFDFSDGDFWKGALVGAAIVMLMTNDELRNSLINGAAKTAEAVKSGFSGFTEGGNDEMNETSSDE
jgi:hypothetical protein